MKHLNNYNVLFQRKITLLSSGLVLVLRKRPLSETFTYKTNVYISYFSHPSYAYLAVDI
jgi:hypothetical protein